MKTCSYQAVESSHCSISTVSNLPISFQRTGPGLPGSTTIAKRKIQSHQPSFEHRQLVQQAEKFMMEHGDRTITVDMLCATLYVSRRTLHNAFREVVGVGPMTYLKIQRMKQVHHQLEHAHPLATTVFDTAYQWGFYHMGHFSRDYKQMFGESPSETLKREPAYR